MRCRRLFGALLTTAFGAPGCTFGDLADYAVEGCTPVSAKTGAQKSDSCDRLNADDGLTCTPYQCDVVQKRCVRKPRDDDHDGDPSVTCGGRDCADDDPRRSGVHVNAPVTLTDIPESADVDSLVLSSEDLDPTGTSATEGLETNVIGTYVKGLSGGSACVGIERLLGSAGEKAWGECGALKGAAELVPRQPTARLIAGAVATAFVARAECDTGRVAFTPKSTLGPIKAACGSGAALPGLSIGSVKYPQSAAIAWYEVRSESRTDPVGGCSTAMAAPLRVRRIDNALVTNASFGEELTLSPGAISVRPPATAILEGSGFLVASPAGGAASAWVVPFAASATPVESPIDAFVGARAVAGAVHANGDGVQIALAAEIGCTPQSLALVVGTLDTSTSKITWGSVSEIAPKGTAAQFEPTIAWVTRDARWLVSWLSQGGAARARRFDADGTPDGESMQIAAGSNFRAGTASSTGDVFLAEVSPSVFVNAPLACGPLD
jgi:hypothetical protein